MKILIVADYFPPQNSIASLRPYTWAKYWSLMGHEVTVLTTEKNKHDNNLKLDCSIFRVIEIENSLKKRLKSFLRRKSVNTSSNQTIETNSNHIKKYVKNKIVSFIEKRGIFSTARMPDFNDFIIQKAYDSVINETFNLVISTAGPYSEHLIAKKLKDTNKAQFWVADYRDLWTQNHIFKGMFPFTIFEEYLESKVNKCANIITTVSLPLAMQIKDKYQLDKIEVIENGFDLDDLKNISEEPFWTDQKVRLVYTGVIYDGKRDPSPLFQAIHEISNSDKKNLLDKLEVIFIGNNQALIDSLIAKFNVELWVKYKGFLSREDSLRMQRDAHALIFLEFEGNGVDGILTGKLFEYLYSGTEILGIGITNRSSAGKLIAESGHGINFGQDSHSLKNYLIEILINNSKKKITKNWEIIGKYSRKKQAELLLDFVEQYKKNKLI